MSATKEIDTHNIILDFGKHKDELLTRVPLGYIKWMINELDDTRTYRKHDVIIDGFKMNKGGTLWSDLAKAELERRGDTLPTVEISGHAIDKASLRVIDNYLTEHRNQEGLYTWLSRMTLEALDKGEFKNDKYYYMGMKLVIEKKNEYPVLKTIMK